MENTTKKTIQLPLSHKERTALLAAATEKDKKYKFYEQLGNGFLSLEGRGVSDKQFIGECDRMRVELEGIVTYIN